MRAISAREFIAEPIVSSFGERMLEAMHLFPAAIVRRGQICPDHSVSEMFESRKGWRPSAVYPKKFTTISTVAPGQVLSLLGRIQLPCMLLEAGGALWLF